MLRLRRGVAIALGAVLLGSCSNAGQDRVLGVPGAGVITGLVYFDRNDGALANMWSGPESRRRLAGGAPWTPQVPSYRELPLDIVTGVTAHVEPWVLGKVRQRGIGPEITP